MRSLVKIVVALFLLIVLLVGALIAYLSLAFNPNDYRAEIETRAKQSAGVDLKINGDIGWSLYPWLALELNDLSAGVDGTTSLAQLEQASASLSLPALLSGKIQIDSVLVSGLKLDLVQNADGSNNWTPAATSGAKAPADSSSSAAAAPSALQLAVNQIRLSDALVNYQDKLSGQVVRLSELTLQADQVALNQAFPVRFSGQVSLSDGKSDPRNLALELSSDLALNLNEEQVNLNNFVLKVDQTTLAGALNYGLSSGMVTGKLKGDRIDLDRYLPATQASGASGEASGSEAKTNATGTQGWSTEPLFDLSGIKGLNAKLDLQFGEILFQTNPITNLVLAAQAQNDKIEVTKLSAESFEGQLNAVASADLSGRTPKFSVKPTLTGIAIQPLLAMAMEQPPVAAKANLSGALTSSGNSLHSLINSLNGNLEVSAAEGVIQGIDLAQELCQNIENLTALGINPDQVDRTTPIADLISHFTIQNGVVSNPDFSANVDAARLDAKGTVDLPQQRFDYNLGMTLTGDLFKESCGVNPALKNTRIPVNCKGNFDTDPAKLCKLDTSFITEVIKKAAGQKVQDEIDRKRAELEQQAAEKLEEKLQDKVGDQLKEDAGNLIKGLFGR